MSKKFTKGELIKQNDKYGVVIKEHEESVEIEDFDGNAYMSYSPSKLSKEEIKSKILKLGKEVDFLKKYL